MKFTLPKTLIATVIACLVVLPFPVEANSQSAFSERVFARALIAGDVSASETWLAQTGQPPQLTLEIQASLRLRPISIVLTRTPHHRQREMLENLMKWGGQLNYQEADLDFKTPLHLALEVDSETQASELVYFILSHRGHGALAVTDQQAQTPLDLARKRYPALAQSLEKFKAVQLSPLELLYPPTAWAKGEKALKRFEHDQQLFEAVDELNPEKLQQAILAGASVASRSLDKDWDTPLHRVMNLPESPQRQTLIQILLNQTPAREAEDWEGNRPLHRASHLGQIALIEKLLKAGVQLNSRNQYGQTPLALAVLAGHRESVMRLLQAGASKNLSDNQGLSPVQALDKKLESSDLSPELRKSLESLRNLF